jgi:Tol biopolymer transport system component
MRNIRKICIYFGLALLIFLSSACSSTRSASQPLTSLAGRGFSGRLVLIESDTKGNKLVELDLASGKFKLLFQAPENGWLTSAQVSPDGQQIVLAYAPTTQNGHSFTYTTDLYLMPYDGSSPPRPITTRKDPSTDSYFNPVWAPDGKSIYVTYLYQATPTASDPSLFRNDIEQISLDGEMKILVGQHAIWPRLSPDGSKMAYLYSDPLTLTTDLFLSNSDGSNPSPIVQQGKDAPVDDHIFTTDGSQLIFSMANTRQFPQSSWLEKLLGVEVASAHNVPSDWYIVSASGGELRRLTNMNNSGMAADLSPDGQQMAFISATGLYIMKVDGSDLYNLSNQTYLGTVDWIPN